MTDPPGQPTFEPSTDLPEDQNEIDLEEPVNFLNHLQSLSLSLIQEMSISKNIKVIQEKQKP